jgi:archaellum biogenesis protein FlaJ (TadC family)
MFMDTISQFFYANQPLLTGLSIVSGVMFLGSLIIIPFIINRLPEEYFLAKSRIPHGPKNPQTTLAFIFIVIKNLMGMVLIFAGLLMLVLPGQGLLTILLGLSLSNFPGKYSIERRLVKSASLFKALNWIRKKSNKPPLQHPE